MERFKKKTLALVLASVVTVVGSFAAGNYKNTVMSLKFESSDADSVNMTILTKTPYGGSINPKKKDQNTYVIMLPEINSHMATSPSLSGSIESVDVKTMPYTSSSNGYTKITIKTSSNIALNAKNAIFIPDNAPKESLPDKQADYSKNIPVTTESVNRPSQRGVDYQKEKQTPIQSKRKEPQRVSQKQQPPYETRTPSNETDYNNVPKTEAQPLPTTSDSNQNSSDKFLLLGAFFVVIMVIIYLYVKTKRKMAEMIGDQSDLDFSETKKVDNSSKGSTKQIKKTISALDQMYKKPIKMPINNIEDSFANNAETSSDSMIQEENNIVDLDELFQKQTKASNTSAEDDNEENEALEAFLSGFSFDDNKTEEEPDAETDSWKNQELFDKYTNNADFKFSEEDLDKMNSLLNTEISENAVEELTKASMVTTPEPKPSKKQVLEEFVTSLTIKQNITFTKEDIDALNKLISVELDNDFISDLRTNPERANSMRREIEERNVSASRKVNEILTLNVKDMLPDLGEALKKQGNKKIESEAKPEVVYYSEGYEYTTLSIKNELPDLTSEANLKSNKYRPSDSVEYAVSGYDTPKLNVDGFLPDLKDVMANPQKYEEKKKPKAKPVNENDLLKNIDNITFKPFYDGSESFEMINNPEDFEVIDENNIKKEFEQFENFTVIEEQDYDVPQDNNNNYEELYENNYYDLDKNIDEEETPSIEPEIKLEEPIVQEPDTHKTESLVAKNNARTSNISINRDKHIRPEPVEPQTEPTINSIKEPAHKELQQDTKKTLNFCLINGESFSILYTQELTEKMGCYLAKTDNGYSILGYIENRIFRLKDYESLNSERLHARVSETLPDGTIRYIVRIGLHKFILNVTDNSMEYVMDLC